MDRKAQPFPVFDDSLPFSSLLYQIELHIARTVDSPYSYEQLRGPPFSTHLIRPLVKSLEQTQHPAIIAALLAARLDFSIQEDDRAIHEARAYTAELVAIRYSSHLSEAQLIQYVTYEIPRKPPTLPTPSEETPLIDAFDLERQEGTPYVTESAVGLSALELAILGDAKKFLLSRPVEQIISSIWEGRIVFWDSISVKSKKKAMFYNPRRPGNDIYSRLRVPKYRVFFMMVNYVVLLALYYAVLTERTVTHITALEIALDVWFAGFVYEEIGQVRESGSIRYYASDYWSAFDLCMIAIFLTFFIVRLVSVLPGFTEYYAHIAFDVLSLEALLLVPRVFSALSMSPYFGTLLPCLKQMTKDFMKFLVIIVILYVGFLTTFSFLGRDHFTVSAMAWLLIRVFFGAPYDGLDASSEISPIFGPTLMLVFVILTKYGALFVFSAELTCSVLLITVVISILSQRFGKMMNNANEEYMLLFASSVMESITTSDRVTYFYPPLNLIGILIRPVRLFMNRSEYRNLRIYILKVTHAPFVAALWLYEQVRYYIASNKRDTPGSMLHMQSASGKKRLWGRGRVAQGLLLTGQAIAAGTDPDLSQSGFNGDGTVKPGIMRTSSYKPGTGTSTALDPITGDDVAKRRKTRKSAVVAKANPNESRPPLVSSSSSVSVSKLASPVRRAPTFPSAPRRVRGGSNASADGARSPERLRAAAARQYKKGRLAISLLRDLRSRRSAMMPADTVSVSSDYGSGPNRQSDGPKLAAMRVGSDGASDEGFTMASLSPMVGEPDHNLDTVVDATVDNTDDDDEVASSDDDDEEEEVDDEDDEDDDDEDFLSLYADQSTVRIRGLEEQVYKMKEMLERMNAMMIETYQRERA
ncbi:hypothetical protein V1512DRAFT_292047 [Lipomyces arxii]|uniref:uncharacterized protein n=1 Tax=Lipomyces arxii TaxID=56418 RepID=UPI0034CDE077